MGGSFYVDRTVLQIVEVQFWILLNLAYMMAP